MQDPFTGIDLSQTFDSDHAANVLGAMVSTFLDPFTNVQSNQPKASTQPQGATGIDESSPVPKDTPVTGAYGEDRGGGGHPGIDLGVPLDTQILAATSGTVTHAANDDPNGYGEWVEITADNGVVTRYGHLHSASVNVGDHVNAGQIIATSGGEKGGATSGNSSGAHLHFEVRIDGHTVDPTPFLAGGYQIVGGTGDTPSTADPIAIYHAQQSFTNSTVGADPFTNLQSNQPATTTQASAAGTQGQTGNFAEDVLRGIGAPITPDNLRVMEAWMRAEGGANHNNPLNTTQGAEGATDWNSVGVKSYVSYQQGVAATIQTLLNGLYPNIINALKAGNSADAVAAAIENSPWGTGGLVTQIIRSGG